MSENKLKYWDRLAIRSQVSGKPLGANSMSNWMKYKGASYTPSDTENPYKFGGVGYNSFDDMLTEVYRDNDAAIAYRNKVETGGDFRGTMGKIGAWGIGSAAGDIFAQLGSTFRMYDDDDFSEGQKATQSTVRSALNAIPVYGPIISAATGLVDAVGSMTGWNLSNLDEKAAEKFGVKDSATLNNVLNSLPGVSMIAGIFGKRTNSFNKSDEIENLRSGYGGTMGDIDAAEALSEKRVLGKNADKINNEMELASAKQDLLLDINNTSTKHLKGVTSEVMSDYNRMRSNRYQGTNYSYMGRSGMKLMSIEEINKILNLRKGSSIQEFKNGGVIGIDSSIIPEGKLHAHKHNLKDANPDLEDVTKKGIPIVTLDEGGELQQVAEIEKEEIIFRKEVTTKLEELYKDGSDEAMIEAGKLIAEELMTNTDDKTEEFINE